MKAVTMQPKLGKTTNGHYVVWQANHTHLVCIVWLHSYHFCGGRNGFLMLSIPRQDPCKLVVILFVSNNTLGNCHLPSWCDVPFFLQQVPSLTEYDTFLNSMLTAGRRGKEENLCASVSLLSNFLLHPHSSGAFWLLAGCSFTTSSIEMPTVRVSNIRSGGPFVFWRVG